MMQIEMEMACDVFSSGRVKIKELVSMSMDFYMSVRTFHMANMAGLIAKVTPHILQASLFGFSLFISLCVHIASDGLSQSINYFCI